MISWLNAMPGISALWDQAVRSRVIALGMRKNATTEEIQDAWLALTFEENLRNMFQPRKDDES